MRATLPVGITLRENLEAPETELQGDPSQFQQIIMNLCSNAIHAMRHDGGVLHVSLHNRTLSKEEAAKEQLAPGRYVLLVVRDRGTGIPESHLKRIFEPFFTTKKRGQGTGLGLSVIHGIVTGQGGAIQVENRSRRGACFRVYLPRLKGDEKRQDAATTTMYSAPLAGEGHIMLVDDDPVLLKIGAMMLSSLGYSVERFERSKAALGALRDNPDAFQLLMTDQTMPELSGIDLGQKVREVAPSLPILICTGYSENGTLERIHELGFDGFLQKPFIRDELGNAVREILHASNPHQQSSSDNVVKFVS